ncbi:MAG: GGDEF domain-containing protein [Trueperaceae bacterium]|nr:GGDEF domain-containing protein [Trueperaceae bacterium]
MNNTPSHYSLEHLPHPFVVVSKSGKILETNLAFEKRFKHPQSLPLTGLLNAFGCLWKGETTTFSQDLQLDSSWFKVDAFTLPGDQAGFIFMDISKWVKQTQRAQERARTDVLTGLPNRTAFLEHYHNLVQTSEAKNLSVVMIDLNNFKFVNDTYGHSTGDDVLRFVAQRLRGGLRQSDLLARWGGDEFIALVQSSNEHFSDLICKRFAERLATPFHKGKLKLTLSASVGCAHVSGKQTNLQQLIEQADAAMYARKNTYKQRQHAGGMN